MPEKSPKKRMYVNNKAFLACIVEYKQQVKEAEERRANRMPDMPRYAGECLQQICARMSTRPNFGGYSYRTDMVQEAVLNCVQAFDNFNPEKSNNPFGYFSRIAWRAMLRTIWDERVQSYVKHKNYRRLGLTDDQYEGHEDYTDTHSAAGSPTRTAVNGQQISDDVIARFEESLAKKKRGAKEDPPAEDGVVHAKRHQPNTIFDFVDDERGKNGWRE